VTYYKQEAQMDWTYEYTTCPLRDISCMWYFIISK